MKEQLTSMKHVHGAGGGGVARGMRESCAGIIWYGVWLLFGKNTPFIKVIRINHKPIYIPNCYYRGRRVRDLMQSVPITTYFVSSNTAHGVLDIILGDIVCQLLATTGRWFSSVLQIPLSIKLTATI